MFFEVKNPYTENNSSHSHLYFGKIEDVILKSVDDVMKACEANDIAMEEDETIIVVSYKRKGKPHQKPRYHVNSRKEKEIRKARENIRIIARERKGEQFWDKVNPLDESEKGLDFWDCKLYPCTPCKLKTRREMRLETSAREMLRDY